MSDTEESANDYYIEFPRTSDILPMEDLKKSASLMSEPESIISEKVESDIEFRILSTLKQYPHLLDIYEKSKDSGFLWEQFGFSLLCRGKWLRAARVIDEAATINGSNTAILHLLSAQLHIQHLRQFDIALKHAQTALAAATDSAEKFLVPRCQLLAALATGLQAQCEPLWEQQRKGLNKAVVMMEECVRIDPHDYLALYYCALLHAIVRDLEGARERCARSLELNPDQPAAYMLMALIFTADGDLMGSLELVQKALKSFPNNYSLLVLNLHIEAKLDKVDDTLGSFVDLLNFWRCREEEDFETNVSESSSTTEMYLNFLAQADMWLALSELFLDGERHADLAPCIEQAISLFPQSQQAMHLKGRLLFSKAKCKENIFISYKLMQEAKAAFLSALALCPLYLPSISSLAELYFEEGNHQMAEYLCKELVRIDPLNCNWWQQLGESQMANGFIDVANSSFQTAAKLDRSTPLLPFSTIPLVFPSYF